MRKIITYTVMLVMTIILFTACSNYGEKLEFNGGDLFYKAPVTKDEANKLGKYLVETEFYDGTPKSVQLNKTGEVYEFRMVAQDGIENDPEYMEMFKVFAAQLSVDVFNGKQVDIHICDDGLETRKVVSGK